MFEARSYAPPMDGRHGGEQPRPPAARLGSGPLDRAHVAALQRSAGNRAVTRLLRSQRATVLRTPQAPAPPKPSHALSELAETAIEELTGSPRKKVVLSTVLNAARLKELRAFTALLKAAPHEDYGNCFVALVNELEDSWGSKITVSLLQLFADAGVDVVKEVSNEDLQPLAAVAEFKSFIKRVRALVESGDLSKADADELKTLLSDAEAALRDIERKPRPVGPRVQLAGGVAVAAGWAWRSAAALAADDVTGVGVADDVAIPFVVLAAAALTAAGLLLGGPKVEHLDYRPAMDKVNAALRKMVDLVAISQAMAINGKVAAGQVKVLAIHLARLLALAAVGGEPSGEPPKRNSDNDKHWWKEIKTALKNFFQATKGASRKQVLRELLKYYTEEQVAEIEATLLRAEELMGEQIGRPLLPPP